MKKLLSMMLLCTILLACLSSCGNSELKNVKKSNEATDYVIIDVEDYGKILIRLYPDIAPITVENFKKLVGDGFYDGLTFHRVIKGFMIQGGCPLGTGTGGSGTNIKGEFSENGIENDLLHERGTVSMARGSYSYDSASSQFFIMHQTRSELDGKYAAFGKVLYGMDTVDKIAVVKTNYKDKPLENVVMKSVYFVSVTGTPYENL